MDGTPTQASLLVISYILYTVGGFDMIFIGLYILVGGLDVMLLVKIALDFLIPLFHLFPGFLFIYLGLIPWSFTMVSNTEGPGIGKLRFLKHDYS